MIPVSEGNPVQNASKKLDIILKYLLHSECS